MAISQTFAGKDIVLYVGTNTDYSPRNLIMCQVSASVSSQKSTTEMQTKCGTKTSVGEPTHSVTIEGFLLRKNDSDDGIHDMYETWKVFNDDTPYMWTMMPRVENQNDRLGLPVIRWKGQITQMDDTYPTEGDATFTMTVSVIGELTKVPLASG